MISEMQERIRQRSWLLHSSFGRTYDMGSKDILSVGGLLILRLQNEESNDTIFPLSIVVTVGAVRLDRSISWAKRIIGFYC